MQIEQLKQKALEIRRSIVEMVFQAQSGHIGGSLSAVEIMVALYYEILKHNPANPEWPERDRFVLSKGHCTPVLYAILADCGYFPEEDLQTFRRPGSRLQGHPYQPKTPGVDASTGTLGLGLSTAMGMALAAKLRGQLHHVFVLCGDGELQEGQAWEAGLFAAKYGLENVVAIVDRNRLQTDGDTEDVMPLDPLDAKWKAFGWRVDQVDGHDLEEVLASLRWGRAVTGKPTMIIANTIKGKGVKFMENDNHWHGAPPTREQYTAAMEALNG